MPLFRGQSRDFLLFGAGLSQIKHDKKCTTGFTDHFTASEGLRKRSPKSIRPTGSRVPSTFQSDRKQYRWAFARPLRPGTSPSALTAVTPFTWPREAI